MRFESKYGSYFWHKRIGDLEAEVERHKHHSKALDDQREHVLPHGEGWRAPHP